MDQRQDLCHAEIVCRVGLAHKSVGLKKAGKVGAFAGMASSLSAQRLFLSSCRPWSDSVGCHRSRVGAVRWESGENNRLPCLLSANNGAMRILIITENKVIHLIWKDLYSSRLRFLTCCSHALKPPTECPAHRLASAADQSSQWQGGTDGKA